MIIYNNLILTVKRTYRLWDKGFINCIDLSSVESNIVYSILNRSQKRILYGRYGYKIILSDEQLQILKNNSLFYHEV